MGSAHGAPAGTTAAEPSASTAMTPKTKSTLMKGMSADTVRRIVGAPQEIRPIKSEAGEGEVWIYRRVEKQWTQQSAVTMESVPGFAGTVGEGSGIRDFDVPAYRLERVRLIQVTRLLMFDGKMVSAVQSREQERTFE